jgi:hypothetical protein
MVLWPHPERLIYQQPTISDRSSSHCWKKGLFFRPFFMAEPKIVVITLPGEGPVFQALFYGGAKNRCHHTAGRRACFSGPFLWRSQKSLSSHCREKGLFFRLFFMAEPKIVVITLPGEGPVFQALFCCGAKEQACLLTRICHVKVMRIRLKISGEL